MLRQISRMIGEGFTTTNGFKIVDVAPEMLKRTHPEVVKEDGKINWDKYDEVLLKKCPVRVHSEIDVLSLRLMAKSASEGGSGAQIDDGIEIFVEILRGLNRLQPSRENSLAITNFEQGLMWLKARTKRRIAQGIEGQNIEKKD